MSESAYDISYLVEAELAKFSAPAARPEKAGAEPQSQEPDAAAVQAAIAEELLNIGGVHEALIEQYKQFTIEPH